MITDFIVDKSKSRFKVHIADVTRNWKRILIFFDTNGWQQQVKDKVIVVAAEFFSD